MATPTRPVRLRPSARLKRDESLVIDLRGNGGGNTPLKLLAALMDRPYRCWRSSVLQWTTLGRAWGEPPETITYPAPEHAPVPDAHRGRLALLIDGMTGSAAEDFAMPFKDNGRAVLVGETTAGSSGQPHRLDLGDRMLAWIGAKRESFPDGAQFEGVGIAPDIAVETTPEDAAPAEIRCWRRRSTRFLISPEGLAERPASMAGSVNSGDRHDQHRHPLALHPRLPAVLHCARAVGDGGGGQFAGAGTKAGLLTILGTEIAVLSMVFIVAVGLEAVMRLVSEAFTIIKLVGAAYLIWIGFKMFASSGKLDVGRPGERLPLFRYVWQGALINWSNPKTLLFLGAFLPQFVDMSRPPSTRSWCSA